MSCLSSGNATEWEDESHNNPKSLNRFAGAKSDFSIEITKPNLHSKSMTKS